MTTTTAHTHFCISSYYPYAFFGRVDFTPRKPQESFHRSYSSGDHLLGSTSTSQRSMATEETDAA